MENGERMGVDLLIPLGSQNKLSKRGEYISFQKFVHACSYECHIDLTVDFFNIFTIRNNTFEVQVLNLI